MKKSMALRQAAMSGPSLRNILSGYKVFLMIWPCLLWMTTACIEEYTPEISRSQQLLIVDGGITSEPGPYTVRLSLSKGIQDVFTEPVSGAVVVIEEKNGSSEVLSEVDPGRYETATGGITGKIGNEYRISITHNDEGYESAWMLLKDCPPIDSLYWMRERHQGVNGEIDGIQWYIDTHDPDNNTRYYRWEYIEDWAFSVPISSSWNPTLCYAHNPSSGIIIGSTEKFTDDLLLKHPITYVDHTTTRLTLRYRIIVIQHAITEEEFRYWEALEELNENLGTLFDPIPAEIYGNIRNVTNPDRSVLGYFTSSTVRTDTMYVDAEEFANAPIYFDSPYGFCNFVVIAGDRNPAISNYYRAGWLLADTIRDAGILYTTMANSRYCFDCTTAGNADPPADWIPLNPGNQ
ncbi:MAG: hypothetical protein AMS26_10015 [Bacteroides sp. SM23_62]|nr:MAG: hypothetical protein AMS26_10015 [Bacteroides sp. SM23_62]